MIVCPNCKNTLPDWVTSCQFCQADVRSVQRTPNKDDVERYSYKLPDKTLWSIYYALCIFWLIGGAWDIYEGIPRPKGGEAGMLGFGDMLSLAFGTFSVLVGLGLLLKIEIIRGIVNVISALNLLFGLIGLVTGIFALFTMAGLGYLLVAMNLLQVIVSGATIWIIGETQSRASI